MSANEGVGNSILGEVTVDLSATPALFGGYPDGQFAEWQNGNFTINAITDLGFAVGSRFGGRTFLDVTDFPSLDINETDMENFYDDGNRQLDIRIVSRHGLVGDGLATVPNPWVPTDYSEYFIYISEFRRDTGIFVYGQYTIDSFEMLPSTIIVGGYDTGITDFQYNGASVAQTITGYENSARNHGAFVSAVTRLANALRKSNLLTSNEASRIQNAAAHSSVGK